MKIIAENRTKYQAQHINFHVFALCFNVTLQKYIAGWMVKKTWLWEVKAPIQILSFFIRHYLENGVWEKFNWIISLWTDKIGYSYRFSKGGKMVKWMRFHGGWINGQMGYGDAMGKLYKIHKSSVVAEATTSPFFWNQPKTTHHIFHSNLISISHFPKW